MSNYIHPMRAVFRQFPMPRPGVICDLVRYKATEDNPEYWTLRLYQDNFDSFSAEDRMVIFNWVSDMMVAMRAVDPNVWVEKFEKAPVR